MRRTLALTTALLCLGALGCADDSPNAVTGAPNTPTPAVSASTPSATTSAAASPTGTTNEHGTKPLVNGKLAVEVANFYFAPTHITAKGGDAVTLDLENTSSVAHTFTIDAPAVDKGLDPREKGSVTFTLPASGTVVFYCKFHQGGGMQGSFVLS